VCFFLFNLDYFVLVLFAIAVLGLVSSVLRQRALPLGHIDATWRIQLNFSFFRPTRVHNPNGITIGSAVFAQLTAERPYTLQWAALSLKALQWAVPFPFKIALCHDGGLDPM